MKTPFLNALRKTSAFATLLVLAVAVPNRSPASTLSGLLEFSATSGGSFDNNSVWNTKGGDTAANLWVVEGTDPNGSLINGPTDAQAGISIALSPGVHKYSIFAGSPGNTLPYFALNLFFNGNNLTPRISVLAAVQTNAEPPYPSFGPNGNANTLTIDFGSVHGANTLTFNDGTNIVTLTEYRWAKPGVYSFDRSSAPFGDPGYIGTNGVPDWVGEFTLEVTGAPACVTPPSGLVGWWPGDGNGTNIAGPVPATHLSNVSFTEGKVGRAFNFNGASDSYVVIADSPELSLSNALTAEFWFLSRRWNPGGFGLFSKRAASGVCNYAVNVSEPYGLGLYYNDPTVSDGDLGNAFEDSAYFPLPSINVFHHLACTLSQVDSNHVNLQTYIDGVLATNKTLLGNLARTINSAPLILGSTGGVVEYLDGIIDEFSLYNRALSGSEIHAIYEAGSSGKCKGTIPPSIATQPQDQTTVVGATVSFSVSAYGSSPLSYQWLHNDDPISGATGSSLTLMNVQLSDAGKYSVRVSNSAGFVVSSQASLVVNAGVTCQTPPNGLVGWWPGNGDGKNLAGSSAAVLLSGVTFAPGKVGQGFNFNGSASSYIVVSNSPELNLSNAVTAEFWFLSRRWSPGGYGLFSKRDSAGICNYAANVSVPYGLGVYYNDPNVSDGDVASPYEDSSYSPLPTTNVFHHFACSLSQSDDNHVLIKTYLDGALVRSRTHLGSLSRTLNGAPLIIGSTGGVVEYFDGIIDEFSLYNRALSDSEIAAIYQADGLGKCTPPPMGTNICRLLQPGAENQDSGGGADDFRSVMRIQECYGGTLFPQQPIVIHELRFRPSAAVGGAFSATISNIQINLSTTTKSPEHLSATFAENVGADNTPVVNGSLHLSSGFIGPSSGPKAFDIVVPLSAPFNFDPRAGSLLVDIINRSGSDATYIDSWGALGDNAGRAFAHGVNPTNASTVDWGSEAIQVCYSEAGTNTPPATNGPTYDLSRDYATNSNPAGPWSYGYKSTVGGDFVIYPRFLKNPDCGGLYSDVWLKADAGYSYVAKNNNTSTMVCANGTIVFPPGTVWFFPGFDGATDNFGAIRFTVPSGAAGQYELVTSVRTYIDGSTSGDADFHVVQSGNQIFGQNIPGSSGTTYSNRLVLSAGETIDFLVGRGADGHLNASGLKIAASLTLLQGMPNGCPVLQPGAENQDSGGGADDFRSVMRIQECYGGTLFPQRPIAIRELRFRPSAAVGGPFSATISNIQINLSTTTKSPEHLSATFAENVGADNTPIVNGSLHLSSSFTGPSSGPKAFDIIIPLSTPFNFDPRTGSLLVDIINRSGSDATYIDSWGALGDGAGRAFGYGVNPTTASTVDWGSEAIQVCYTEAGTNTPPTTNAPTYDLSRDYSTNSNPGGAWSYGWKSTIGGEFVLYPRFINNPESPGLYSDVWLKSGGGFSYVAKNNNSSTIIVNNGTVVFPPGTVWFFPGFDGAADNFGAIRFTVPSGAGGEYQLTTSVRTYIDGSTSGDADFHVVQSGNEIFGQNIPGSSGTTYSNRVTLRDGETLDFLVGRGADGQLYASGLKIAASLTLLQEIHSAPVITSQPHSLTVNEGDHAALGVNAAGSAPLGYQWYLGEDVITDGTNSTLVFEHAEVSDSGDYHVIVSNNYGSVTSQVATLTVVRPRVLALGGPVSQQEGTTISLPVNLISDGDVAGLTFKILYDPTYLGNPQLAWTSLLDGSFNSVNTNTSGQIRATFGATSAIDAGTQTLAHVSFFLRSVPTNQTTALTLQIVDASDANGNPLTGTIARSTQVTDRVRRIIGDNNANDRLDVGDATVVLRYLANLETPRSWDTPLNDVNQNGSLDSGDSIRILRAASGIDPQPTVPGGALVAESAAAASLAGGNADAVLSPARIQTTPGANITVQVQLQNQSAAVSGASFRLNYNTNALRLVNAQSYHLGAIVPANALSLWNVAPSQNNFATQNGSVSLAVSSASQWGNNNGVLAEFTFQVQSRATSQYLWPITLSAVETTEDGYANHQLTAAGAGLSARAPVAGTTTGASGIVDGKYSLTISGDAGASYVIEASSDLHTWETLTTVVNSNGTVQFTDNDAGTHDHRFYRARPASGQ